MLKKGFTLVELLIVIGILAVLATATVLILNPGELLAQGRDSSRISDMNTLNSAMSVYLTDKTGTYSVPDTTSTNVAVTGSGAGCQSDGTNTTKGYVGVSTGSSGTYPGYSIINPTAGNFLTKANSSTTATGCSTSLGTNGVALVGVTTRGIDGLGWIPLDFTKISTGAPFGSLPADPTNSGNLVYRANFGKCGKVSGCTAGSSTASVLFYEFNAVMESVKYTTPATSIAATDGGDASTCTAGTIAATCAYEKGNTDNKTL